MAAARSALPSAVRHSTGSAVRSPARASAWSMTDSLWSERGLVDAGAATGDLAGGQAEAGRDQRRGGRGVADAHVAAEQQLRAGSDLLEGDLATDLERLRGLLGGERVLEVDGAAAAAYLVRAHVVGHVGQVLVDADVEHPHVDVVRGGQRVDAGQAGDEGAHHRARDRRRVRRDAVGRDAVVAGEDHQPHVGQRLAAAPTPGRRRSRPRGRRAVPARRPGWPGRRAAPGRGAVDRGAGRLDPALTGWPPARAARRCSARGVEATDETGQDDAEHGPHGGAGDQRGTAEVPERVGREVAHLVDGRHQLHRRRPSRRRTPPTPARTPV